MSATASYDAGDHATYYWPQRENENHGVAIVGWDDTYPSFRFQGARRARRPATARSSCATAGAPASATGGYFWVSYYDGSFALDRGTGTWGGCTSYSDVEDVTNYSRIYQYDELGVNSHWGYGSSRVWGANRFTAAAAQNIAAAGFYTLSSSTQYEVWAGRTLRQSQSAGRGNGRAARLRHRPPRHEAARLRRTTRSSSPSS